MAEQVDLRIAQRIQVTRDGKTWFNSIIQDIRGNAVYIATPYLKERPLVLYRGEQVQVRFFMDDSSYLFETRVTGEATSNIKMYRLAYPGEIERVQQRMHVRLSVVLDAEYAIPEQEEEERKKRPSFTKATTVDLSGGGMKLMVREMIKEDSLLLLKFTLPLKNKPEQLELEARVIRCIKTNPDSELYNLGLRFENLTFHQEDIMVRFIFEKMARQKRLL